MADAVSSGIRSTKELGGGGREREGRGGGVAAGGSSTPHAFFTCDVEEQAVSLDIVLLHGSRGSESTASHRGSRRSLVEN